MSDKSKLLVFIQLMLFHTLVYAGDVNQGVTVSNEIWNDAQALKAQFVERQNVNYLTILSAEEQLVAELLIPRSKKLANISWSSNDQYLTFTEDDRNLWLFNIGSGSVKLIEHKARASASWKFNAQWSPNGQWLQYITSNNERFPVKVYSLQRKHAYHVPVAADAIASIRWHDHKNELLIITEQPSDQPAELAIHDMTLTLREDEQLANVTPAL